MADDSEIEDHYTRAIAAGIQGASAHFPADAARLLIDSEDGATLGRCLLNNLISDFLAQNVLESLKKHGYTIVPLTAPRRI